jgi:hypothetical protein
MITKITDYLVKYKMVVYVILISAYGITTYYHKVINPPLTIISPYQGAVNWTTAINLYMKNNNLSEMMNL